MRTFGLVVSPSHSRNSSRSRTRIVIRTSRRPRPGGAGNGTGASVGRRVLSHSSVEPLAYSIAIARSSA
eukprot:2158431-Lingulodinium_polyedra.AAC.1